MTDTDPRLLWRLKLTYWIVRYYGFRNPFKAWQFSGQDCWADYYRAGYAAHSAILEDMSYD